MATYDLELQHGDTVYIRRKHHWWVEKFVYARQGFRREKVFVDNIPPDVIVLYANGDEPFPTLEEADACPEPLADNLDNLDNL